MPNLMHAGTWHPPSASRPVRFYRSISIRNPLRLYGDGHSIRQFQVHISSCRSRLLLAEIDGPRTEATLPLTIARDDLRITTVLEPNFNRSHKRHSRREASCPMIY